MVSAKSNSKSKSQLLNIITGTDKDDILKGAGKKEVFNGLSGNDTVSYEAASSGVIADLGRPSNNKGFASGNLYSQIENLVGSSFGDKLYGNSDKNILDGGGGKDVLSGKDGNDTYLVDITSNGRMEDTIIESSNKGSGTDTIKLRGSYNGATPTTLTLNPNLENLEASAVNGVGLLNLNGNSKNNFLLGNGADNLINGFSGNDHLIGLGGIDVLKGGYGNDKLVGGAGNDELWGGKGQDVFIFSEQLNSDTNVDLIKDFEVKSDLIHLDRLIFTKLSVGSLNAAQFVTSETITVPEDQDNYVYYDTKSGGLFYDEDGSGNGAMIKFASLANNLALSYENLKIV